MTQEVLVSIGESLSRAHDIVARLEDRLQPVMVREGVGLGDKPHPGMIGDTPLAEALCAHLNVIQNLNDRLSGLEKSLRL